MMTQPSYLIDLLETGRVKAAANGADAAMAVAALPEALSAADAAARLEMPGIAPPLAMPAALWAATIFYHACRFLVYREISAQAVQIALAARCPLSPTPSSTYSVDLTFRYLPDLIALARGVAEEDPLVQGLLALARAWPLSSVGVALPAGVDPTSFIDDRCLLTVYAERIVLRNDVSRLKHPAVRKAVREAIGLHPELSPVIVKALEEYA
jgi:hypothetical protein